MRRFLSILLTFLLAASSLAACAPAKTDTDDQTDDKGEDTPSDPSDTPPQDLMQKQREVYEIVKAENSNAACLIQTVYPTEQTVIANVIVTPEAYDVDPTGQNDSTQGIQKAIDDCRKKGGGTVFLPVGQYLVSRTIQIGEGVLLQGDWQDPDLTSSPEYGTVILAKIAPLEGTNVFDPSANPLFRLNTENASNNGLCGLTVYYPDQDIHNVKPYGYTVYATNPRMTVLRNLTFINAYQGIGASLNGIGHELLHIEKVRMTALVNGYQVKKSSEIGYTYDLSISPKYWSQAAVAFRCSDAAALRDFCRENTVAMKFHSLDLNQYTGIRIDSAYTAMLIDTGFWGIFSDVRISDSVYGIVAKALTGASGVGVAHATIEADVYAVANYASGGKPIKLTDVKTTGKGGIHTAPGAYTMIDNSEDLSSYNTDYGTYQKPADILYVADVAAFHGKHRDAAPAIQAALDQASATGGIVYVPHGVYHLYSSLSVPSGVELRGAMAMAARDHATTTGLIPGTVFLTYLQDGDFITLSESSGVQGLRIFYVPYDAKTALGYLERGDRRIDTCVGIRGTGKNVYAVNMVVTGCFVGIDFTGCDNHLVKNSFGCTFRHFVRAGGKNGQINAVLCNQTFTMRQPFYPRNMYDAEHYNKENWKLLAQESQDSYAVIRDLVVRSYCDTFCIVNAENETINNAFMYGCHSILVSDHASVVGINLTSDWQGICPMFVVKNNSSLTAFNPVRTSGSSHESDSSSSLKLFNRLFNIFPNEPTYRSDCKLEDNMGGEPLDIMQLLDCDSVAGVKNVTLNTDLQYVSQGKGSLKHDGKNPEMWLDASFAPVDTAKLGDEQLYLHLSVWIDNPHQMEWSGRITLKTAKGDYCFWGTTQSITQEGWNDILLPIPKKSAQPVFTGISITVNHSRLKNYPTVYVDDIYVCNVTPYAESMLQATAPLSPYPEKDIAFGVTPSRIMINDCEALDQLTPSIKSIAKINTDPEYIKSGDASIRIDARGKVFFEQLIPATDIRAYENHGYLHMWVYLEGADTMSLSGQIELTSGGMCDIGEKSWSVGLIREDGWNELYLPLQDGVGNGGPAFNASAINYLRMYNDSGAPMTVYIDDIYICNVRGATYDESNTFESGNVEKLLNEELPTLHRCDTDFSISAATLNTDPTYIKEGTGSLKAPVNGLVRMVYTMPKSKDISDYMKGYLHMWVYINDVALLGDGQIELCSGGTCDKEEISWSVKAHVTKSGWNELYLPLSSPTWTNGGTFNPSKCNYLRVYTKWNTEDAEPMLFFDDIRLTNEKK
jgi:hypothetical protein